MEQLLGDYGKLAEQGDLADGVFVVEGERFPLAPLRAGGAGGSERVLSGSLQVGDAGRGHQGGVLRGRECLSIPGAAVVPLRGRAAGVGGRERGGTRRAEWVEWVSRRGGGTSGQGG
jgi:hypothetical protein